MKKETYLNLLIWNKIFPDSLILMFRTHEIKYISQNQKFPTLDVPYELSIKSGHLQLVRNSYFFSDSGLVEPHRLMMGYSTRSDSNQIWKWKLEDES